jgi:4-aminobutyrate aminotransferase-like enzyme
MNNSSLLERRNKILGNATLFYSAPVHIVRGDGAWLYDENGKKYLDMYNNVPCVGHANSRVAQALFEQANTLNVHSRYLHESILQYGERLVGHHHAGIQKVVFSCTGTEANEVALMMARLFTGGRGIICSNAAYHGNSAEVRKLSHLEVYRDPTAEIRSFPFPQTYRPIEGDDGVDLADRYIAELAKTIDSFKEDGIPFAGLLLCSLLANEGLPDIPDKFMARAADLVHAAGGVIIADEVQAGVCRSGEWWGYEKMGFVPDIVSMGKPLGNGMPIAATAASAEIVDQFRQQTRYFNTFASSPLQAAAGNTVLDILEQDNLKQNAREVGAYMTEHIKSIAANYDFMGDIRDQGLFIGIEWVSNKTTKAADPKAAKHMADLLMQKGVLVSNAGQQGNVLKIRPPLVFNKSDADYFLNIFTDVLKENKSTSFPQ